MLGFSILVTAVATVVVVIALALAVVAVAAATMISDEGTFTSFAMISVVVDLVASTTPPAVAVVAAAERVRLDYVIERVQGA